MSGTIACSLSDTFYHTPEIPGRKVKSSKRYVEIDNRTLKRHRKESIPWDLSFFRKQRIKAVLTSFGHSGLRLSSVSNLRIFFIVSDGFIGGTYDFTVVGKFLHPVGAPSHDTGDRKDRREKLLGQS